MSRYFCESLFWASQPNQAAKITRPLMPPAAPIRPRHLVPTQQGVGTLVPNDFTAFRDALQVFSASLRKPARRYAYRGLKIFTPLTLRFQYFQRLFLDVLNSGWLIFSDGFANSGLRPIVKRCFDIFASSLLLAVSWWVMLITAIAIYIESGFGAPIFYRQQRVGYRNQVFDVIKFRSMRVDAEKHGAQWASTTDDRVTRVGKVIRKYRIDELPQLLNVFKGDMSFVGPRPERPEFVDGFVKTIPYYKERHRVKPGITGWAQLCYPYGANEYDTRQKLQYDLYYVKNYSLFLDFTIMLSTVEVILWGKGAR